MTVSVIELRDRTTCVLCRENLCFEKGYGPDFGLCSQCAGRVCDLYHRTHSGSPPDKPEPRRRNISAEDRWMVLRLANYTCQICGDTERPLHVDHVKSLAKGGSDSLENLQCLCDKCNLRKGTS